jgi:hypothetical protein
MTCKLEGTKKYTHRKRLYHADCYQWNGSNTQCIIDLLQKAGCSAEPFRYQLMLRWSEKWHSPSIDTMSIGDWVREGENGALKVYSSEKLESRYEAL